IDPEVLGRSGYRWTCSPERFRAMMLLRSPGQLPGRIIPGIDRHSAQCGGWGGGPARVHHGDCISDVRFQSGDVVRKAENSPMWYGNTKNLLESIVRGLNTEPRSEERCITAIAYRMYGSNPATLSGRQRILQCGTATRKTYWKASSGG